METLPEPWEELLSIFQLSTTPIQTGLRWLDEMLHSSRFLKTPNFDEFLIFLITPVPKIGTEMKLIAEPKLAGYSPKIQLLLLEFLQVNFSSITGKCVTKVTRHIEQFYNACDVSNQLLRLLRSKPSTDCIQNIVPALPISTAEKRHSSHCLDEQPVSKKMRVDTTSRSENEAEEQEFQSSVESKDFEKAVFLLKTFKESSFKNVCDVLSCDSIAIDENFIVKIGFCMTKEKEENPFAVASFLNTLWLVFLKQMVKTASRPVVQMITQILKDDPQEAMKFFASFLNNAELNSYQSTFILNISKQVLTKQQQLTLFRHILLNKHLPAMNFSVAVATYLGFLNLQISLDEQDLYDLCNFFENYSKSASKNFNFAKLLLAFLKKNANRLPSEKLFLLQEVVSHSETSLKSACKTILTRIKPN